MLETALNLQQTQTLSALDKASPSTSGLSARQQIENNLSDAESGVVDPSFKAALSYAEIRSKQPEMEEFGFDDFVDMINPLQHIPLVNILYREVTGDEIDSAAQILGSAAYGGFAGAASGIANAIVEEETGRDIGGNFVAMMQGDRSMFSQGRSRLSDKPEDRLSAADDDTRQAPHRSFDEALEDVEQEHQDHPQTDDRQRVADTTERRGQSAPSAVNSPYAYVNEW